MFSSFVLLALVRLALAATVLLEDADASRPAQVGVSGRTFWVVPRQPWPRPAVDGVRYRVLVEPQLWAEAAEFGRTVDAALGDPGGWARAGRRFMRVDEGPALDVVLAAPETVDRLCHPLQTAGQLSCGRDGRAVINVQRWRGGSAGFRGELRTYRNYVVNHEVGHLLGQPHRTCPGVGRPAPVMVQQTKGLGGCSPRAQPSEDEIARLRRRWLD